MKKISILIPCYNEEKNVIPLSGEIVNIVENKLASYDYEIIFIDNCSTDNTRPLLRDICNKNHRIKAIFNARNFGQHNSPYYGLCQTSGDCSIHICADFQDPVELIPVLVEEWEKGYKIISCIKTKSKENRIIRFLRTCYYKIIKKMSDIEQIEHFTGFGLYDKSFIDILRSLHDPIPFLRGVVAELGFKRKEINYEQQKRRAGKTKNNWYTLYDAAMLSFTSYTKIGLRIATIVGFITAAVTFVVALVYFIYKLLYWDAFSVGIAPLVIGVFFLGSLQLFFIGFIGEYVMSINTRLMNRPLVIEEERINFD
ncbi:MAG: glycosyltransferase family 2 protein [Treponema sp.]|jgi:glycosyltransferase involved in cell wall biosynthesis|nr:glycosyltransferase family 2 protein [Treponema sp.]